MNRIQVGGEYRFPGIIEDSGIIDEHMEMPIRLVNKGPHLLNALDIEHVEMNLLTAGSCQLSTK